MALDEFTPPSMKGLNYNIDAPLIFTGNQNAIELIDDTHQLLLCGGTVPLGHGATIELYGENGGNPSAIVFCNSSGGGANAALEISPANGINVKNNRLQNVADPSVVQDAATKNYVDGKFPAWATWAPTLTWTGGTPTGISTTARYIQIGKIVHYMVYITATDSKGVTNLTISTPSTAANQGGVYCGSGFHGYGAGGTTFEDSFAVVVANTALIQYEKWTANTSGQGLYLASTGFYEVP